MRRVGGLYKATEAQSHTVVINEVGIPNVVAIHRVTTVQIASEDAERAINTENGSPAQTATKIDHIPEDDKEGDNNRNEDADSNATRSHTRIR